RGDARHGGRALRGELRESPGEQRRVITVQLVLRFIRRHRVLEAPERTRILGVVAVLNAGLDIAPRGLDARRPQAHADERRRGERTVPAARAPPAPWAGADLPAAQHAAPVQ